MNKTLHFNNNRTYSSFNSPFLAPLDSRYLSNPNTKSFSITFNLNELYDAIDQQDISLVKDKLSKLIKHSAYTVFIKIRYNEDLFSMGGSQFGFKYTNDQDLLDILDVTSDKIRASLDKYALDDDNIVYIQLIFRAVDIRIITEFEKNNSIDNKERIRTHSIPISIDSETLGIPLSTYTDINDIIYKIDLDIKGVTYNFLDRINEKQKYLKTGHKDKIPTLHENYTFFYVNTTNTKYVLAIDNSSESEYRKIKFSLSGVVLSNIVDKFISSDTILRIDGNTKYYIVDGKVVSKSTDINFYPLKEVDIEFKGIDNPNIGVIDCETFLDKDDVNKIYSLGYKTNLSSDCVIYYVENKDNINSEEIVLKLVDELLRPKYSNVQFFCHNLGGYDSIFIINTILNYNENQYDKSLHYKINTIFRDDKILQLTISRKINDKNNSLIIKDSFALLNSSLNNLGKNFNVDVTKGIFPYDFSRYNNLFYIGETPNIRHYKDISSEDYKKLITKEWSFKDETIKYLEKDLISLYQVISKANKQVFLDFSIDMIDSLTISSLAMKLFMSKYYNNNIPSINKVSVYNDIKEAYYGGITEVYIPQGKDLFYYDVNSLYPYVALNDMPGLNCCKEEFILGNNDLNNQFGFYYCEIECHKNNYLGLLPVRNKSGIYFPNGKWKGWYFSEELKFARDNGYKIKLLHGYSFNRVEKVFDEYISDIYKIKSNPLNPVQKSMAKSLLNNLLGRFGIRLDKGITEIMSESKFNRLALMKKITNYVPLGDDRLLTTYVNKLDNEIIKSHNLDIVKLSNQFIDNESNSMDNTSVVISAAITAYARIFMNKIKLDIINKGGKIYYSDTDSIVTNIKLDKNIVDENDLGKFKLEHKVKEGIFISGKTYCLITQDDVFINRAKGVIASSLNYDDYINLLQGNNATKGLKTSSIRDWKQGQVEIKTSEIILRSDSYTKRDKVYDNGVWVNTKPLYLKESNLFSRFSFKFITKFIAYFNRHIIESLLLIIIFLLCYIAYLLTNENTEDFNNQNENQITESSSKVTRDIISQQIEDKKFKVNTDLFRKDNYNKLEYYISKSSLSNLSYQDTTKIEENEEIPVEAGSQDPNTKIKVIGVKRTLTDDVGDLHLDTLFESEQNKKKYKLIDADVLKEMTDELKNTSEYIKKRSEDHVLIKERLANLRLDWNTSSVNENNNSTPESSSLQKDNNLNSETAVNTKDSNRKADLTSKEVKSKDWSDSIESFDLDKLFKENNRPTRKPSKEDSLASLLDKYDYTKDDSSNESK